MTPNEIRAKKNMNKIEGGDTLFIQQNMSPMELLGEILQSKNNGTIQAQTQTNKADATDAQTNDDTASEPAAAA